MSLILKNNKRRGFTLVEMIVSLGIFSVVAVVALGALVSIVSANKKAQSLQATITNLNFALETMSREMRVGFNYHCYGSTSSIIPALFPQDCSISTNSQQIAFESSTVLPVGSNGPCNAIIAYRFPQVAGKYTVEKAQQNDCNQTLDSSSFVPIISPKDVTITDVKIAVETTATYPLAFIKISGYSGARERERSDFNVQMAVSSRFASQ